MTRRFGRSVLAGPAVLPDGGALLPTTQVLAGDADGNRSVRLRVERLDPRGRLTSTRTIADRAVIRHADLATDSYGRAVAAGAEIRPVADERGPYAFTDRYELKAVSLSTKGRIATPVTTLEATHQAGTYYGGQVRVAVDGIGRAVVAFATAHGKRRQVDLFLRPQIGRFTRRAVAGPNEGGTDLAATFTPQRRAVVV